MPADLWDMCDSVVGLRNSGREEARLRKAAEDRNAELEAKVKEITGLTRRYVEDRESGYDALAGDSWEQLRKWMKDNPDAG